MGSETTSRTSDFTTTTDIGAVTAALDRALRECRDLRVRNAQLEQSEATVAAQLRLAALGADVGGALTGVHDLADTLQTCAQAVVDRLDAAFARIWTLNEPRQMLELRASAGLYTHLNGPHGRVPVGKFKIGLIARERKAHVTNHVIGDPRIGDQDWARRMGMVAFAGYPLMLGPTLLGVLGMFARRPLTQLDLDALATVGQCVALGIARAQAIDAIRDHETRQRGQEAEIARLTALLARRTKERKA